MIVTPLLHIGMIQEAPVVQFYGWEVVRFVFRQLLNQFFDFSWQVRTSYFILLFNIITIILLSIMFIRRMMITHRADKLYEECSERYYEPFTKVLLSPIHWSVMNIEKVCECSVDEFAEYNGATFARLLCDIRVREDSRVHLPNMQLLAELTGVRAAVEEELKKGIKVIENLEVIDTLCLHISEGRLAVYTSHRDKRLRQMARECLTLCTESDPFRYLESDLNEHMAPARFMSLHRLFNYLSVTNRQMPPFITIANNVTNDNSAAFMINEVAYWGTQMEREALPSFFLSERLPCRIAAMRAVGKLGYTQCEEELIETYSSQPEEAQMELLSTIITLNTGLQAAFLERAYLTAPSKRLAEKALECLYKYGEVGRKRFEQLRHTPLDRRSRYLLDQIESMGILDEMRAGRIESSEILPANYGSSLNLDEGFESDDEGFDEDFNESMDAAYETEDEIESVQDDQDYLDEEDETAAETTTETTPETLAVRETAESELTSEDLMSAVFDDEDLLDLSDVSIQITEPESDVASAVIPEPAPAKPRSRSTKKTASSTKEKAPKAPRTRKPKADTESKKTRTKTTTD